MTPAGLNKVLEDADRQFEELPEWKKTLAEQFLMEGNDTKQLTPAEEKAYVVARWSDYHDMTYGRFDICDMDGNMDWHAAYLFTVQREAEIADVEEEIFVLRDRFAYLSNWKQPEDAKIYARILAREQAALAELKKGWK